MACGEQVPEGVEMNTGELTGGVPESVAAYSIEEVTDLDIIRQIGRLRVEAWGDRLHPDLAVNGEWLDDFDLNGRATHLAAFANGTRELIGAARLTMHDAIEDVSDYKEIKHFDIRYRFPIAWGGRLVIKRSARDPYIAAAFDREVVSIAREKGATAVYTCAIKARMRTLAREGFECLATGNMTPDERYEVRGIRTDAHLMCFRLDGD